MVDTEGVGQLIYTKSIGSDRPENLTQTYKGNKSKTRLSKSSQMFNDKSQHDAVAICRDGRSRVFSVFVLDMCDNVLLPIFFQGPNQQAC